MNPEEFHMTPFKKKQVKRANRASGRSKLVKRLLVKLDKEKEDARGKTSGETK